MPVDTAPENKSRLILFIVSNDNNDEKRIMEFHNWEIPNLINESKNRHTRHLKKEMTRKMCPNSVGKKL